MRSAFNEDHLSRLLLLKEVKQWYKHHMITSEQWGRIREQYASPLYHPNFAIRLLLILATFLALWGVTGFFFLFLDNTGEKGLSVATIIYGFSSFFVLNYFITRKLHYKSGVNEALLYQSLGFTLGGLIVLLETDISPSLLICFIGLAFSAWRYLDLLSTAGATGCLAAFVFMVLHDAGGVFQAIIPFAMMALAGVVYFIIRHLEKDSSRWPWSDVLLVAKALSLVLIYASVNYFVVRELSISMMNLQLEEGEDIPFAGIFYVLTCLVPLVYLWFGIRNRDLVLLRISLLAIAFTVFTFRYYFSIGHPEIILTVAGAILIGISYWLFQYLKVVRGGFTRDALLAEKWSHVNVEAFVFSQTLGGNVAPEQKFKGGGGEFGGGGATGNL